MIPKIHKKGASFSGIANYLLHDKDRAPTSERVVWTRTRNLATQNPHAAWRVMAATAMDAPRLKREAGIKATGQKARKLVLHLSISWHGEQKEGLTKDEMLRAANGAIRALGADKYQTLIVAHDDTEHPHVHIVVNRVSTVDGRLLSDSYEKDKLSDWAEEYEREGGKIYCEQRVINNAARRRGEYTRGEPDKPRHIYELEAANDNTPDADKTKAEQKKLDLALARKTRELKERHAKQTAELVAHHRAKRAEIQDQGKREHHKARDRVRADFRPLWEQRFHETQAELRAFEKREDQLLGRVSNALRSIDFGRVFTTKDRKAAVLDAYNAISSSGGRLEAFKRSQAKRDRELERQQRQAEAEAAQKVKAQTSAKLVEQRALFKAERATVGMQQGLEQAGNRTEWRTRGQEREAAFGKNRLHGKSKGPGEHQQPSGKQTIEGSDHLERLLDSYKKRVQNQQDRAREQDNERDRGDRTR